MRSIGHPDFAYRPHSDERRQRASALAKRRLGAPAGHSTVYGVHVPDKFAERVRLAAAEIARKQDAKAAASFVGAQKMRGFKDVPVIEWTPERDAALRRFYYAGLDDNEIAGKLGRPPKAITLRRGSLKLRTPPRGCRVIPVGEVRKLVAGHLDEDAASWNVTFGTILVASQFIAATVYNIAAWANLSTDTVRTVWWRMKRAGVWDDEGLIDRDRYMRETDESAFLLVLDVLLARGIAKRTTDENGEELWCAA